LFDEDWDFSFDLNVKSMHRTISAFLPACWRRRRQHRQHLLRRRRVQASANRYVYGATKAAVSR
jgi:2-keto-3-deoxy-L-fuconate dehydrogenase